MNTKFYEFDMDIKVTKILRNHSLDNMNKLFLIILLFMGVFMFNCAGTRPTNLGVKEGKLLTCPDKKNCVLSQADIKDPHYIDPFKYSKDLKTSFNELKSVVESEKRTKVVTVTENYLYVEFKSLLMGYVDDVEFYFDDNAKIVHVRSASRLGSSDFGVNRKRIEHIRSKLNW